MRQVQTWHDLLFAHWPVPAAALQPLVPAPLIIDEHDGTGWVGLIPFRMTGVRFLGLPALPGVSSFPEMNLRTYVVCEGQPGVWFFSLDAGSRLAVWAARRFYHLPYFHAAMHVDTRGGGVRYRSDRHGTRTPVRFAGTYWPTGAPAAAKPGSTAYFLTERYRLFAVDSMGGLFTLEIAHPRWPLQPAAAEIELNEVASAQGVPAAAPVLLHFSRRLDVTIGRPGRARLPGSAASR